MTSHRDQLSHLGAAIAELREAHGMSQADVISHVDRALDRGLSRASLLDAIERGERDPGFLTLVAITRAMGVTLGDLFAVFDRRRGVGA